MNNKIDYVQFGKDFYLDLKHDGVQYKGVEYSNADLERKTHQWANMKRFMRFLYSKFQEESPPVNYYDLYVAYEKKFQRKNISDMETFIKHWGDKIDPSTVYKMYNQVSQMIVNFQYDKHALKESMKESCYIKKNSDNQYWYEVACTPKEDTQINEERFLVTFNNQSDSTGDDVVEKDNYYLNEIKKRALQLDGEDKSGTLYTLERVLFNRRKELSNSAKDEIDRFFGEEFFDELVKQGLSTELAHWYSLLWYLWTKRQEYKEGYERAKAEQEYERMEMKKKNLDNYEDMIDEIIDKITTYNKSLEIGGKM